MHTPLHHRRRMEETLDQTELINNSWEMVAPAKMSAATNSYNHRDAKHTHAHTQRPFFHIQRSRYKHNDSGVRELSFHHNGGILWAQNCWHKLAPSKLSGCIPNCEALHLWYFRKREGIYCHSTTEALIYKAQESGKAYVVLWACVQPKLYFGRVSLRCLQQQQKKLLGIQLSSSAHNSQGLYRLYRCLLQKKWKKKKQQHKTKR